MRFAPFTSAGDTLVRKRLLELALPAVPDSARAVFVIAPAGYGKTTLLCQIRDELVQRKRRPIWFNCSCEDREADVFLANLNGAFHAAGLTDHVTDYGVADLIRLLSDRRPAALVIDEFENASSDGTDVLLEHLVRALPDDCWLFLASREAPKIGLTKLVLDGRVRLIDATELRFTDSETGSVIADANLPGPYEDLIAQSEGWPVMVQLARLDSRAAGPADSLAPRLGQSVGVFDYRAEQILSKMDIPQRDFLLQVSILSEVDAASARAITGLPEAEKLFHDLLRLRPIVTVTSEQPAGVRLHPLFRDFLRHESVKYPVAPAAELHRRAALHFSAAGELSKAIPHAAKSGSQELVADMLENAGGALLNISEGHGRVRTFLSHLPPSVITRRPRLCLMRIMQQAVEGTSAVWIAELEHFIERLKNEGMDSIERADDLALQTDLVCAMADAVENRRCKIEAPWPRVDDIRQKCLARKFADPRYYGLGLPIELVFLMDYGSLDLAQQRVDELMELFTSADFAPNFSWISNHHSYLNLKRGNLAAAEHYAQACLDRIRDSGETRNTLARQHCNAIIGQCHFERDDLDLAMVYFSRIDKTRAYSLLPTFVGAVCTAARISALRGDTEGALAGLEESYAFAVREKLPHFRVIAAATIAEFRLLAGDVAGCREWIAREKLDKVLRRSEIWFTRPWIETEILVRLFTLLWAHDEQLERAHDLAHEFAVRARQSGRRLMAAKAEAMVAELALRQGRRIPAMNALARALDDAEGTTALRPFVDLSPAGQSLLRSLARKKDAGRAETIRTILDAIEHRQKVPMGSADSVSPREKDVLVGLSQGQPTKIIARELDLSYETVRHHLKNIYAKLDVHTRDEAVGEARRRSII